MGACTQSYLYPWTSLERLAGGRATTNNVLWVYFEATGRGGEREGRRGGGKRAYNICVGTQGVPVRATGSTEVNAQSLTLINIPF